MGDFYLRIGDTPITPAGEKSPASLFVVGGDTAVESGLISL
jgi:hypothetical protein